MPTAKLTIKKKKGNGNGEKKGIPKGGYHNEGSPSQRKHDLRKVDPVDGNKYRDDAPYSTLFPSDPKRRIKRNQSQVDNATAKYLQGKSAPKNTKGYNQK